jgi:hypothetical protein
VGIFNWLDLKKGTGGYSVDLHFFKGFNERDSPTTTGGG